MKNLTPLAGDPYEYFKSIRDSKMSPSREHLEGIDKTIKDRFRKYGLYTNPILLERLKHKKYEKWEEEALLNCYNSTTKELDSLKIKIKEIQGGFLGAKCQYCGISAPDSFDHYLPKSVFPEFSVYSYNLIPCCPKCNLLKSNAWIHKRPRRRLIINFYYDELPSDQYLFIKLKYNAKLNMFKTSFILKNRGRIDAKLFKIIKAHYKKLNLFERFEPEIGAIFEEVLAGYKTHLKFDGDPQTYRIELYKEALKTKIACGENDHKALIYEALSDHPSLLQFLVNAEP